MPLATSAQATPPNQRGTDYGTAATADEAETAQNADSPIEFQRQAGPTRFETAAEIATARFDTSTDVVIATGEEFADALAGAGLEGTLEAPVLLVPSNLINGSIPSAITNAIDELGATSATLLGGEDAISTGVENHIENNSTVTTSDRVEGPTRFETAEEIANRVSASPLPPELANELDFDGGDTAFLATGLEFADALAAGPGAYEGPHPTLLTPTAELHPAAERGLNDSGAENVIILGGTDAVSSSVESSLNSAGFDTARLAGVDRWETATEVAEAFVHGFDFGEADAGLATGFKFADALASAPYLGEAPAPVVLTPTNSVNDQPLSWFEHLGCQLETLHIFGGQAAVQDSVAEGYAEAACSEPTIDEGITGTVTDAATGDPIEGAEVTAENSNTFTDTTDADGEYTLEVDTPETYTVTADADGYQAETVEEVFVDEGEVVTQDFELSPIGPVENLSLTPQEDTNPTVGLDEDGLPDQDEPSEHTTTASLTDENGNAVGEGEQVRFEVYDRDFQDQEPFAGDIVEADANGEAAFTYEFETDTVQADGFGGAERDTTDGGDDIIVACVVPDTTTPCVEDDEIDFDPITGDVRNIVQGPNDTAEKAWEQRELDALVLDEQTSTVNLSEETHTVTGSIVDQFEDLNEDRDGDEVHMHVLDEDGNDLSVVDENGDPDPSDVVDDGRFSITYEGPNIADDTERTTHRIIVCEEPDVDDCLTNGDLDEDVLADEVDKDWVEITGETVVRLNWQNEFREDANAWGGVDDFAASELANDGNGTIDLRFNSDLGVVSTHGWVNVTSEIPDDGSPAGSNFHLHSGAIDAEGPVEVSLITPQLVTEPSDDRGDYTYDLTGTVQDEDASSALSTIEDTIDDETDGELLDNYLNVHTVDNPAGEVRGQLQELDTDAGATANDADGGLSEIPSLYEQLNLIAVDSTTEISTIELQFDASVDEDNFLDSLDDGDFTVTVNGSTVNHNYLATNTFPSDQIELEIDHEVEDGDEVEAVIEESGLEKLETAAAENRDEIGDDDLTRVLPIRGFTWDADTSSEDRTGFPRP